MTCSEEDQLLTNAFHLIIDKIQAKYKIQNTKYFKSQRNGVENRSSNIKDTFSEIF